LRVPELSLLLCCLPGRCETPVQSPQPLVFCLVSRFHVWSRARNLFPSVGVLNGLGSYSFRLLLLGPCFLHCLPPLSSLLPESVAREGTRPLAPTLPPTVHTRTPLFLKLRPPVAPWSTTERPIAPKLWAGRSTFLLRFFNLCWWCSPLL